MRGVDTNILLRHIVRDDEDQARVATAFIASRTRDDPAFISLVVLAELVWALRRRYGYSSRQVHALLVMLLETAEFHLEDEVELVQMFVGGDSIKGDIADHFIAYSSARAGCISTVTFDKGAASNIPSMELLS
jgi:predicted nucleic-acid-binding protein